MKSILSKRSALMGLAVLVGGLTSSGAFAQDPTDVNVPAVTIKYADLDLANSTAVKVLYRRVEMAAKEVCNHGQSRELMRQLAAQKCVDNAMINAIQKIDVPQLNALAKSNNRKLG